VDAFFNPYQGNLSQWNTDLRYQDRDRWYVEVGQRYTNDGNRVRRGDIWNPISFNEVFAPTPGVHYATGTLAFRAPYGFTFGGRTYYDMKSGQRPETDLVGVYQNPCKCWSVGFIYIQFPDRVQYNFVISLTGIGATEALGTQLLKQILNPLLQNERGVPWPTSPSRMKTTSEATQSGQMPGTR
jgi:LPS-assembly protein